MDKTTAHKILLDFMEDKADPAQYQAALNFLASNQADPARPDSPAALYQQLTNPGGIDCQTCQNLMLTYLDPFDRLTMSQKDREKLQNHIEGCLDCREELEVLRIPESEFSFEIKPGLTGSPAQPLPAGSPIHWPSRLQTLVERLTDKVNSLKVAIHFKPAYSPITGGYTRAGDDTSVSETTLILFEQPVGRNFRVNAAIYCSRQQATDAECTVRVILEGPALVNRFDNHPVTLVYGNTSQEALTNKKGEAIFTGVPVSGLATLEVNFKVDIY